MDETKTPIITGHYMPQLDGLRAFAVSAVLVHHISDSANICGINLATLGVWLFFVLSGFLITGILLRSRDQVKYHRHQASFVLRQFYFRRFLRIFPLYYFVLSVAAIFDLGDVRETIFWHLAYTSNYLFAMQEYWSAVTAHLWSLSVEEQFYILWPAVILFTPRRILLKVIIAAIATVLLFRTVGFFLLGFNWMTLYTASLASLDTLGLGAILAYCSHQVSKSPMLLRRLKQCSLWLGMPGVILVLLLHQMENYNLVRSPMQNFWVVIEPIVWALVFVWLVDRASSGFRGIGGKILESRPLLYIGKISYGIYVYHLFIYFAVPLILYKVNVDFRLLPRWTQAGLLVGVTVGIAAISWRFFESPINSLKNRCAYAEQNARRRIQRLKAV